MTDRFPRPVVCAWCGNRHRSVLQTGDDLRRGIEINHQTQGDDCAASVFQVTEEVLARARTAAQSRRRSPALAGLARIAALPIGEWLAQGHYGSGHDTEIYHFVQNAPAAPAEPICDNCLGERIIAGDLERIEGHFPW